jgi:hypothetical protein
VSLPPDPTRRPRGGFAAADPDTHDRQNGDYLTSMSMWAVISVPSAVVASMLKR